MLECIHGPSFTGTTPMTVPHLHGGVIPMRHDGHPDFQFSPGANDTYRFPNPQRAAMLWYHDHSLGLTRLNVYMGLAGAYILRDAFETNLRLPSGKYEMPLVIMDRDFNPDGSLKYQSSWASTFFGKYYLVNGKVSRKSGKCPSLACFVVPEPHLYRCLHDSSTQPILLHISYLLITLLHFPPRFIPLCASNEKRTVFAS